jgi:hypothetical protein
MPPVRRKTSGKIYINSTQVKTPISVHQSLQHVHVVLRQHFLPSQPSHHGHVYARPSLSLSRPETRSDRMTAAARVSIHREAYTRARLKMQVLTSTVDHKQLIYKYHNFFTFTTKTNNSLAFPTRWSKLASRPPTSKKTKGSWVSTINHTQQTGYTQSYKL